MIAWVKRTVRQGVTLIEVVFAIGVILIGLLGLISILPLAGRRAQDAIDLNVGAVMGERVLKELESRRYLTNGRLKRLRADTSDGTSLNDIPTLTISPALNSFCIDPIFASSSAPLPAPATPNGYTRATFPFYRPTHNPLADPSTASSTAPLGWPTAQPRMTRVGIFKTVSTIDVFLSSAEALAIVENPDDLIVTRPDDRTQNATFRDSELTAISGALEYGARIPRGEYTWIATVNPMPGGVYASISIVILKKRERNFEVPLGTAGAASPQGNAIGERVAYVTYGAGFDGGAGGVVHLVSSDKTVPSIRSDSWVMLSRNVTGVAGGPNVHRWYRVVSVSNEPERFTIGATVNPEPNLGAPVPTSAQGQEVWRHKVLLDGPDWAFGHDSGTQYADNTFLNNTYATIVSDVVSVTERVVLMEDL